MKLTARLRALAASLLAAALLTAAVPAQQTKTQQPATPARAGAPRPKPDAQPQPQRRAEAADLTEVTLDEMFAADAYAIYGEMRTVGQHFASDEFRQMIEPLKLMGLAPPDLTELYDFVAAHAEQLAGARIAFGGMPVKSGLPSVVAAVEMPSSVEANMRAFLFEPIFVFRVLFIVYYSSFLQI